MNSQGEGKTGYYIYKDIHMGELISKRARELDIDESRIASFFSLSISEVTAMYEEKSIDSGFLLMWSKLLEYDFFRIYSQHLILYAPASGMLDTKSSHRSGMPKFRKSIYTKEVIDFMIELVNTGQKTISAITAEYGIPKTTLHKWVAKYRSGKSGKN
ncbi:transposase [Chryseobacterium sp. CBSDS_008]|uniref:transposase n=1 Tax=Chryseobacterium sp. CBSDS_008 TaxID=3415265 RepID=UPI003CFBA3C3